MQALKILKLTCRLFSTVFLVCYLSACGPKVALRPDAAKRLQNTLAILPPTYPDGVQRERIDYLHNLLRVELGNAGFFVLDDRLVRAVCKEVGCAARTRLAEKYGATTFVELMLESTAEVDFFAGYYNALAGRMQLSDERGEELLDVSHVERERGGVLFETGQVVQGVIAQVKNRDPEKFNNLGGKFVRSLVALIPRPITRVAGEVALERSAGVSIVSFKTVPVKNSVSEICVMGSKNALAFLQIGDRKSTLRETIPGTYCGIFRLDNSLVGTEKVYAELRSAFGLSARKEITATEFSRENDSVLSSKQTRRL